MLVLFLVLKGKSSTALDRGDHRGTLGDRSDDRPPLRAGDREPLRSDRPGHRRALQQEVGTGGYGGGSGGGSGSGGGTTSSSGLPFGFGNVDPTSPTGQTFQQELGAGAAAGSGTGAGTGGTTNYTDSGNTITNSTTDSVVNNNVTSRSPSVPPPPAPNHPASATIFAQPAGTAQINSLKKSGTLPTVKSNLAEAARRGV